MKSFKYEVLSKDGAPVTGILEAGNRDEAISRLRAEYPIVNSVIEVNAKSEIHIGSNGRIKEKALSLICRQLAIVLSAGIPIVRAVELVAGQTEDKHLKGLLKDTAGDLSAGYALADSLETHAGKRLPSTFIETVRAGEQSGNLEQVFDRLATYYDKQNKIKGKVVSALIYPAFVIAVAVIVVIVIMVFAVPMFSSTFESMGIEMPLITQVVINTSNFFTNYIVFIIAAILIIIFGLKAYSKTTAGALLFGRLALRIPIAGRISLMNASAQFASTMSIMLGSGLSVIKSVDVTALALSNKLITARLQGIVPDLEAGKRLAPSVSSIDVFPDLIVEMVNVGEETGSLENTLSTISEYYDNEVEVATARALSILEPAIIVVLAVFVVIVLLSVYLPMFSMYGNM